VDYTENRTELLRNSLDFLFSALAYLENSPNDKAALKYGVLHLSGGVELLFKSRLAREHWTLIFHQPQMASPMQYVSGDFVSATAEELQTRLRVICGVVWSDKTLRTMKHFRELRNRYEHFHVGLEGYAVQAQASAMLDMVMQFINDELTDDLEEFQEEIDSLRATLPRFRKFADDRLQSIKSQLEQPDTTVVVCPLCRLKANVVSNGATCKFCGYENSSIEGAADEYISIVLELNQYRLIKDGGVWPRAECPECGAEALVETKETFVCFGCGRQYDREDLMYCAECDKAIQGSEDNLYCTDCTEYRSWKIWKTD